MIKVAKVWKRVSRIVFEDIEPCNLKTESRYFLVERLGSFGRIGRINFLLICGIFRWSGCGNVVFSRGILVNHSIAIFVNRISTSYVWSVNINFTTFPNLRVIWIYSEPSNNEVVKWKKSYSFFSLFFSLPDRKFL